MFAEHRNSHLMRRMIGRRRAGHEPDRARETVPGPSAAAARLARFAADRSGNVVIMFSLSLVPILFCGGIGIDYGTNLAVRQKVQNAVDGTALTLAKLPSSVSDADLVKKAETQIRSMVVDGRLTELTVTSKRVNDTIEVTATGKTPTTLTRLGGFTSLDLEVTGIVRRGSGNLEVALVLDNTGSMKGTKLTNLKKAAKDLVNVLYAETDPGRPTALKIGVVPFSMTVNVGSTYLGQSFLDTDAKSSIHTQFFVSNAAIKNRFTLFQRMKVAWGGCVESRPMPYDVQETAPTTGTPETLFVPFFAPDESDKDDNAVNDYMNDYPAGTPDNQQDSRNLYRQGQTAKYSSNLMNATGTAPIGYKYGPNAGCEITQITRLTTSRTTVDNAIDAMNVVGDTNIPMGLVWGWHLLSPLAPFSDGAAYTEKKTTKYAVLMTDGQNASAPWGSANGSIYSGLGYAWQQRIGAYSNDPSVRRQNMDARLTALCTNMKNAGIQIFAVRVEVNEGTSDVLKNCATSESMFFDVQNSSTLSDVFRSIGAQINDLRISG